jgi:hypothetical protein
MRCFRRYEAEHHDISDGISVWTEHGSSYCIESWCGLLSVLRKPVATTFFKVFTKFHSVKSGRVSLEIEFFVLQEIIPIFRGKKCSYRFAMTPVGNRETMPDTHGHNYSATALMFRCHKDVFVGYQAEGRCSPRLSRKIFQNRFCQRGCAQIIEESSGKSDQTGAQGITSSITICLDNAKLLQCVKN